MGIGVNFIPCPGAFIRIIMEYVVLLSDPDREVSPLRFNPFNKEPPLDAKFANFESKTAKDAPKPSKSVESPKVRLWIVNTLDSE